MSYDLAEGFGNLSDGTHTAGVTREILGDQWASFTRDFVIEDRADGRKWLKAASGFHVVLASAGLGLGATFSICLRVYRATAVAVNFGTTFNNGGIAGCGIGINATGNLVLGVAVSYPGSLATPVHPSVGVIPLATETHIEYRITLGDGAAGSVSYYINGVLDTTHANVDTLQGTGVAADFNVLQALYDARGTGTFGLPTTWKVGDYLIHTEAAPIGDVGCFYLPSNAAGVDADFTPSAGQNYENVDEIGPDEDVTYNESDGTAGHRDSFQGPAISSLTVLTVLALARMRKTSTGSSLIKVGAVHGGSETQGANRALSEAYLTYTEFIDDCPSTGNPWTTAEVSAAEASYEVQ